MSRSECLLSTVLAGVSAGAICWFEQGITDSSAAGLSSLPCLGFLPGSCCPHYSDEAERRAIYPRLVAEGATAEGIAIDDGVGVHFIDRTPHALVATSPTGSAYRVSQDGGGAAEAPLELKRIELGKKVH